MAPDSSAQHAHPTTGTYVRVAAILVVLTVLEVGVFYVPAFHGVVVPFLLVLSAAKFLLVVLFYMHLKTDNPFFSLLLGAPLLLAMAVFIGLLFVYYGAVRLRSGT